MLFVSLPAPLFPRHPAGLSSVEGSGSWGHRQSVHGARTPSPIKLQLCCGNFHMPPRLTFPLQLQHGKKGDIREDPTPHSIQSGSPPPLCPHVPFSLSVLTVALPACSPLSPSYKYSCDGFISPRETLCNDWCSSPRGWEGLHTGTVRVQMPLSLD